MEEKRGRGGETVDEEEEGREERMERGRILHQCFA